MPTRIRMMLKWDGAWYHGWQVAAQLKKLAAGHEISTPAVTPKWQALKQIAEKLPLSIAHSFVVFREPRRMNRRRSRFHLSLVGMGMRSRSTASTPAPALTYQQILQQQRRQREAERQFIANRTGVVGRLYAAANPRRNEDRSTGQAPAAIDWQNLSLSQATIAAPVDTGRRWTWDTTAAIDRIYGTSPTTPDHDE